jgi:hypothetical protein
MATVSTPPGQENHFGATARRDAWWLGPLLTFLGLLAFLIYANLIVFAVPGYFEIRRDKPGHFQTGRDEVFFNDNNPSVAPYLAPFSSPLLYDAHSHHAWIHAAKPGWWPDWAPFSSAMLILVFPAMFRFTCYYYRKAYYRSWWMDPPACAVGEPRKGYLGENHWPLLIQNSHRWWMYAAVVFLVLLGWDAVQAFVRWGTDEHGNVGGGWGLGVGLGSLIMLANVVLLAGFTVGCNSVRHLVGGRLNHFSCFNCPVANGRPREQLRTGYYTWRFSTRFNDNHMLWAWLSLFSVGFTDLYIRLCAMGVWTDPHVRF